MSACVLKCQRSDVFDPLRDKIAGNCELPVVNSGNLTLVFWKNCKCSYPLSHFSVRYSIKQSNPGSMVKTNLYIRSHLWILASKC